MTCFKYFVYPSETATRFKGSFNAQSYNASYTLKMEKLHKYVKPKMKWDWKWELEIQKQEMKMENMKVMDYR